MGDFEYVVRVLDENKNTLGTGLLLNDYVATVHHVINGSKSILIEYKGDLHSSKIDYVSDESDVAFLKVEIEINNKPNFLSKLEGKLSDTVLNKTQYIKGFPNKDEYKIAFPEGRILTAKIKTPLTYMNKVPNYLYKGFYMTIISDIPITKGFSGAPVYDDNDVISGFIVAKIFNEDKNYRIIPVQTYLKINEKYRALFGDEKKPDEINPKEKEKIKCLTKLTPEEPVGFFEGRKDEMEKIKKLIIENSKVVLISGMGGMGKTEICKKIYDDVYDNGLDSIEKLAWIKYESNLKHSFWGQFREVYEFFDEEKYFENTIYYINELGNKLLLFIDNIEDTISLEDIHTLKSLKNRVIFTSRFTDYGDIKSVKIDKLSENECANIYINILQNEEFSVSESDVESIKEIIRLTDCHTLTVTLLAKTQVASLLSVEELLNKLLKEGFDLKGIDEINYNEQSDCLIEHLLKVFYITNLNEKEVKILKLFSLFPAINIEKDDALEFFNQKNLKNLNSLVKKGWLNRYEKGFAIHTVLASVAKHMYKITFEEAEHIIKSIGDKLYVSGYEVFTNRVKYLPLADSILKNFQIDNLNIALLFHNAAFIYLEIGNYDKALEYNFKALKIREKALGKENLTMATSYNNIGLVYRYKGEYEKALEYYLKALEISKKVLEKENTSTAISYDNIGSIYRYKGEYEKALEYHFKALKIQEKVLEKENPSTASSYNSIGLVYSYKGEYKKALEYYFKALEIFEKVLGKENQHTAASYNNIGLIYQYKGENEKALKYYFMALEIQEKVLGKESPDTATSYDNIGLVYIYKGDYEKTLKYLFNALEIREKVLGKENPGTAISYNHIGRFYRYKKEYEKALVYYFKALKLREKVLGIENPDTATSYGNIGLIYSYKGEYEKALVYHFKALEICEKVLGKENPDTAISYNNIGLVYLYKEGYEKALEYYFKALEIQEKVLGKENPLTARSYDDIGRVYLYKGEYEKALKYHFKTLEIREKVPGKENLTIAKSYDYIGKVYRYKGEYLKAFEYYFKALEIKEKIRGKENLDISTSYDSIGLIYSYKGDYVKALEYYFKALEIQEKVLGEENLDISTSYDSIGLVYTYNNIGLVYSYTGDYEKALEYYFKALEIQEKVLGEENPLTATSYNYIGNVYRFKRQYEKALEYHFKALKIFEKILGKESPSTATSYNNIGLVYNDKENYEKALEFCSKTLEIRRKVLGEDNPYTIQIYNTVDKIYESLKGQK